MLRLKRFVKTRGYSIVHYNWLVFPAVDLLFMRWLKKQGIAVVVNVHNIKPHDDGKTSRYLVTSYHQADHLITFSDHIKKLLTVEAGVAPERIAVIPLGGLDGYLSSASHTNEDALPVGVLASRPLAVCLGKIRPYKGIPDLLHAWPKVIREIPDARLVVAGQLREDCRSEVLSAMEDLGDAAATVHTEFTFLSCERYQSYLQAATVLIQPYRDASQSGNTAQAFECGVPVVCTRVGGLAEMIMEGQTGAVAEPGDIQGLAEATISVLKANAQGEMAPHCRRLARERFSWRAIIASVKEVYARILPVQATTEKRVVHSTEVR